MAVPKYSSPLRKVSAFHDLPSLISPKRLSNPPSYTWTRPSPGERIPDGSLLPRVPPLPQVTYDRNTEDSINSWLSNLPEISYNDMFHSLEKQGSAPSTPGGSLSSWTSTSRIGSRWLRPWKFSFIAVVCLLILSLYHLLSLPSHHGVGRTPSSM